VETRGKRLGLWKGDELMVPWEWRRKGR